MTLRTGAQFSRLPPPPLFSLPFFSDRKEEGRKQSLVINLREGGKTIVKRRRKGIKRGRKPFISSDWNLKVISSGQDLETNTDQKKHSTTTTTRWWSMSMWREQ